jgi:hypothetical protein
MNGYAPTSTAVLPAVGAVVAASILSGFFLTRRPRRGGQLAAWATLLCATVLAEGITRSEPGGLRMLAICAALLYGFKAVVGTQDLAAGTPPMPALRWLGFVLTWPGMNPTLFAERRPGFPGAARLIRRGVIELAAGVALIALARWAWLTVHDLVLTTALLLVGLSLVGHFGLFGISAGLWRSRGVPCSAPFEAPLKAESLSDFWAHRWNRPFSELVQRTIYRPVAALAGRPAATGAGFLLSGLLHELAISVPARAGYGRPLAYFALQGVLVLLEKRLPTATGWRGRLRTTLAFALPVPLLLIPAFLRAAIWPLIGID